MNRLDDDELEAAKTVDWRRLRDSANTNRDDFAPFIAPFISCILRDQPFSDILSVAAGLPDAFKLREEVVQLPLRQAVQPTTETVLRDLHHHWTANYERPFSLNRFLRSIHTFEAKPESWKSCYARVAVFIQSSGVGKSRLADKCSESIPSVAYVLRGATAVGSYGYPPGDTEVLNFFLEPPPDRPFTQPTPESNFKEATGDQRVQLIWSHAQVIALLHATFEVCKYLNKHDHVRQE